jgi:hypothetical protein
MRNPSFEMSVNLQSLSMKGGGEERAIGPARQRISARAQAADEVLMADQSLAKIFDTRFPFSYSLHVGRGIFLSHKTPS